MKKLKFKEIVSLKTFESKNHIKKAIRLYLGENYPGIYLTYREQQIFRHVILGCSAAEIADILHISNKTVESHIENIKVKCNIDTIRKFAATAIYQGWLPCLLEIDLQKINAR